MGRRLRFASKAERILASTGRKELLGANEAVDSTFKEKERKR